MKKIALIAVFGAAGTVSRYYIYGISARLGGGFPWGTLMVNLLGCGLFGLVWAFVEERIISPDMRTALLVGFMGGLTTFSTYAFETAEMLRDTQYGASIANAALQNIGGVALFFCGLILGRYIL